MSDRRITQVGIDVEYTPPLDRRPTQVGINVEYTPATNVRRATTVAIMVEYAPAPPEGRVHGPAAGHM